MSGKLEIVLSVVEDGFGTFKKYGREIDELSEKTGKFSAVASAGGKVVSGAFVAVGAAIGAATAAYAGIVKPALDMADALQKQADIAGVSTTTLQEYSFAAKQSGSSAESLTTAMSKLTENAYNAYAGNDKLAKGFRTLGVDLRDAKGNFRDTNDIVNETFKKLSDLPNPAQQSALAVQLLGKGGRDLVPMLRGGSAEIDRMRGSAQELGQVLSEEAVKNLDKMGDNLDMLGNKLRVSLAESVNLAMPSLELFADGLSKIISKAGEVATGIGWMLGGEKKFNEEIAAQDAITRELQDMIKLKAEYNSIIGAQEAFKAHKSELFDEETLVSYKAALKNLEADIRDFNKPKVKTGSGAPVGGSGGGDDKADKKAMKGLKSDYTAGYDALGDDAKARWENQQKTLKDAENEKKRINKEAEDNLKKHNGNLENLDRTLAEAKIKNEKDATKAAGLKWKENDRLAREAYRKSVKDANGNADEIAKANELKNENLKSNEAEYFQTVKNIEEQKRQTNIANAREQLDVLTNVLKEAASRSKAAAVAYKTLAIATTIIDTYSGAQKAFNSLASIPYVGYALGIVAAGATVVAGMMRVNEIRKQQFASGGISSGGVARVGEMGAEDVYLPAGAQVINHHNTQQLINNQNRGTTLNVTINANDGSTAKRLVREIRDGSGMWAVKQILKAGGLKYAGA
jgi:hypothetical protein